MGNNLRCGCKCQNSPNEDEVNLPQQSNGKAQKSNPNSDNNYKEDSIPNEFKSKFDKNSSHSDEGNIQMEVFDDNKIDNKQEILNSQFKKTKPIENGEILNISVNKENPAKDRNNSIDIISEKLHNESDLSEENKHLQENLNIDQLNDKEEEELQSEIFIQNKEIEQRKGSKISSLTEQFNREEIEKDFDNHQLQTLKQNLLLSKTEIKNTENKVSQEHHSSNRKLNINPNKPTPNKNTIQQINSISTNNNNFLSNDIYNETEQITTNKSIVDVVSKNFLEHHKIILKDTVKQDEMNLSNVIEKISLMNNLLDDVIFYSELQKLNHNDNLSKGYNRKYITRFCAVSKKEFKYFQSKEKFITLQKPINIIDFSMMKKVSLIDFEDDEKNKILTKKNLKNFDLKVNSKDKKPILHNFIIMFTTNLDEQFNNYEIFASENEEFANKWVSVINYFIDSLNNL